MKSRTLLLIVGIVAFLLLATGGTIGAMALTNSGFMRNNSSYGMMNGQNGPYNQGGMMGGTGRYQQNPSQRGTPVMGMSRMNIQNMAFMSPNIQVKVGTTVTWTNQDSVPHSVTFKNGMKDSGLLYQGQSFSYTFNTPGTYQYYCTVHPYMVASVTVVS